VDAVRDALALMVSGEAVPVKGFLTSEKGRIFIPNKELMDKFKDMLRREPSLGYVYRLAKESERMLEAAIAGDTETMADIFEYAYNTKVPLLHYNNETGRLYYSGA